MVDEKKVRTMIELARYEEGEGKEDLRMALPEEVPSVPVKTVIHQLEAPRHSSGFAKFNFDKED